MNKHAPRFREIPGPLDVSDDALNELGDKLGVPSLVKPEQPPAPASAPQSPAENALQSSSRREGNTPRHMERPLAKTEATSLNERVSVDLPEYLGRAMRVRVAEEGTTMRYLVMQGLQAIGLKIDARDFVSDGRSARFKAR